MNDAYVHRKQVTNAGKCGHCGSELAEGLTEFTLGLSGENGPRDIPGTETVLCPQCSTKFLATFETSLRKELRRQERRRQRRFR